MTMVAEEVRVGTDPWAAALRWVRSWWHVGDRDAAAPEADRARRAFVDEMLSRNADAFGCEADVQGMMHLFPERF